MKKILVLLLACTFILPSSGCGKTDNPPAEGTTTSTNIEDRNIHEEFLPLGSVVMLEGGNKRLMICSRIQTMAGSDVIYDYCACYYPEGITSSSSMIFFNREDINEVYFIGYEDQDELEYQEKLNEITQGKLVVQGDKIVPVTPEN